jgi:hypothetical protein
MCDKCDTSQRISFAGNIAILACSVCGRGIMVPESTPSENSLFRAEVMRLQALGTSTTLPTWGGFQ